MFRRQISHFITISTILLGSLVQASPTDSFTTVIVSKKTGVFSAREIKVSYTIQSRAHACDVNTS